jgi:hypothetical protein
MVFSYMQERVLLGIDFLVHGQRLLRGGVAHLRGYIMPTLCSSVYIGGIVCTERILFETKHPVESRWYLLRKAKSRHSVCDD